MYLWLLFLIYEITEQTFRIINDVWDSLPEDRSSIVTKGYDANIRNPL